MISHGPPFAPRVLAPLSERGLALSYQAFVDEEHITVLPGLISRSFALSLDLPPGAGE